MQQSDEPDAQTPRADMENLEEECLVMDPEWEEDVYKRAEILVRGLNHACGALRGLVVGFYRPHWGRN